MKIAPVSDRRRYEPLGMSTALWQGVPPEPQLIAPLVLQQDAVDIAALLGDKPTLHDEFPHVVVFEGTPYVSDGHHRIVSAFLRGETRISARVLRLDA